MSQHLIDTGRHASVSEDERTAGMRSAGDEERGFDEPGASRGNGAHATGAAREARGPEPSGDPTLRALEALSCALAEVGKDEHLLEERLKHLQHQREQGRSWHQILGDEDPPGTMQLVSRILASLAKGSGTLRKELVDSLRQEGVSIPAIARLFGVTHQRVSNLLRRPAE